jgi:hypothetical protein
MCYTQSQSSAGSRPYAMIIDQSGGTLTTNTAYMLADENASSITISMVSATTGVAAWTTSSQVRGCIITVSGTTITAGTPITIFDGAIYGYPKVAMRSATTLVCAFQYTQSSIQGAILTISGSTLSVGSFAALNNTGNSAQGGNFFIGVFSETYFILCSETASGGQLYVRVFSVSGTVITSGTAVTTTATSIDNVVGCVLTSTRCAIAYFQNDTGNVIVRTVTISGTTPTINTAYNVDNNQPYGMLSIAPMTATSGIISYGPFNNTIRYKGWTLSTNAFTLGTEAAGSVTGYYMGPDMVQFTAPAVGDPGSATYISCRMYWGGINMQTLSLSGTSLTLNGVIYPVNAYAQPNANSNTKLICSLSATRSIFLCGGYVAGGAATALYAVLVDHSGSSPSVLQSISIGSYSSYASIAALSSTTAIVTFRSTTSTNVTRLITMSGNTFSVGNQATISSATTTSYQSVCRLTDTTAVAFYRNSSTTGYANVLTVSGTSISVGSASTVTAFDVIYPQVEALTSTKVLAMYGGDGTDANVLTISGTTITVGAKNDISLGYDAGKFLQVLSSTKAIVSSGGSSTGNYGGIVVLAINGDVVTGYQESQVAGAYYGFKMAFANASRGIALNSYYSLAYQIDLANNIASIGLSKPFNCAGLATLKTPVTANNFAPKFAVCSNDGYAIQVSQINSIGAIN